MKEINTINFIVSDKIFKAKNDNSHKTIKDNIIPILNEYLGDQITYYKSCIIRIINKGVNPRTRSNRFSIDIYVKGNYSIDKYSVTYHNESCYLHYVDTTKTTFVFAPLEYIDAQITVKFSADLQKVEYVEYLNYRGNSDRPDHLVLLDFKDHNGDFEYTSVYED